jgi:hypothetical protein
MDARLTNEESAVLKELAAAGDKGRTVNVLLALRLDLLA